MGVLVRAVVCGGLGQRFQGAKASGLRLCCCFAAFPQSRRRSWHSSS